MFLSFHKHWKSFKKSEKGMFTIEASLIFPTIFIVTLALILFSLVVYEKVVVYEKAHLIAERTSFTWDNSKKKILKQENLLRINIQPCQVEMDYIGELTTLGSK